MPVRSLKLNSEVQLSELVREDSRVMAIDGLTTVEETFYNMV